MRFVNCIHKVPDRAGCIIPTRWMVAIGVAFFAALVLSGLHVPPWLAMSLAVAGGWAVSRAVPVTECPHVGLVSVGVGVWGLAVAQDDDEAARE